MAIPSFVYLLVTRSRNPRNGSCLRLLRRSGVDTLKYASTQNTHAQILEQVTSVMEMVQQPRLQGHPLRFMHRVNSKKRLHEFITSTCTCAEGDVVLAESGAVIMAHPPDRVSDLDFKTWVGTAEEHHYSIKIDLKQRDVIPEVVYLTRMFPRDRLILNADVVKGTDAHTPQIDVEDLVACRRIAGNDVVISVGCTTKATAKPYSDTEVTALMFAAKRVGGPITTAIRAQMVAADPTVVQTLREQGLHLSLWNDPRHFPATDELYDQFREMAPDAYIDLADADGKPVFGSGR